ncbi:MAG TPA: UPF0182 family protein [Longimicrobiales bacterium]|nr:UPF0182 family protein [Longimicrobiales bacterium]
MRNPGRLFITLALLLLGLLLIGRLLVGFYTDLLWFNQVQYSSVFWTRWITDISVRAAAGLLGAVVVFGNLWVVARRLGPVHVRRRYGNLEISEQIPRKIVITGVTVTAILAGWWLASIKYGRGMSLNMLTALRVAPWGAQDPLFQRDLSFYIFSLPAYLQLVDFLLLTAFWALILTVLGYNLVGGIRWQQNRVTIDPGARMHTVMLFATMLLLMALRFWIGRYGILLNGSGINGGVGYTDVHARLLGQRVVAVLCLLAAGAVIYSALRNRALPAIVAGVVLILGSITFGYAYPAFVQKFRVDPNEFALEEPYIKWNIDFTRRAYGLDRVQRQAYDYRRPNADAAAITNELRLAPIWDSEPLQTVYNQLQALFRYYHFNDVDKDRYGTQQVAISVREVLPSGISDNARTWQNIHFDSTYIRGLGAVVSPATVLTEGEPPYWLRNINPLERTQDTPPEINLTEPSVYFGETMNEFAVIRERTRLAVPETAVPLSNFLRVTAFAWRFADKNLLFTGGLAGQSHILYRRRITDRVRALAPFLVWDTDPYPVIHRGRIVWMIDGYTASQAFPIARRIELEGLGNVRYLRNSVKATIDAVSGVITLYAYDAQDPLLRTYANAFPSLFRPVDAMPADLRAHVRYPVMYLREQAELLGQYHLINADAFYRGEDVWQLPVTGESTGSESLEFSPVYQMMRLPGDSSLSYVLAAPFIARQRRNMTALLIVQNNPDRYGELTLYELPRNQLIAGPGQVETLIEQDPAIARELSLWRQRSSQVGLGRPRIMPVDSGFIYLIPLFLSAQGSPIPELARVIVSDGTRVSMASTLEDAVAGVFGGGRAPDSPQITPTPAGGAPPTRSQGAVSRRALELLDQAERALRDGDYAGFGRSMNELKNYLRSQQ